jgi:hypothetical protein
MDQKATAKNVSYSNETVCKYLLLGNTERSHMCTKHEYTLNCRTVSSLEQRGSARENFRHTSTYEALWEVFKLEKG